MKVLFAITTFGESHYTKLCLDSISLINEIEFDLLIIDDCSKDDTIKICNNYHVDIITKDTPKGLTDSWNIAYKYFKKNNYDLLILSNNDILTSENSINELVKCSNFAPIICPLSTDKGVGNRNWQSIHNYYSFTKKFVNKPNNFNLVQNEIIRLNNFRYEFLRPVRMKKFSGFFFLMNKKIIEFEFDNNLLFNPSNINVGNEDELNDRLIIKGEYSLLCKTSFVYHFKGISFKGDLGIERNDLDRYH